MGVSNPGRGTGNPTTRITYISTFVPLYNPRPPLVYPTPCIFIQPSHYTTHVLCIYVFASIGVQMNSRMPLWKLTLKQQQQCDRRWKSLSGHPGFVRSSVTPFQRTGSMKIHDWHIFMGTDAAKFIFYEVLPAPSYELLCRMVEIFKHLLCLRVHIKRFRTFWPRLVETMCLFESLMPLINHVMVFHLILEIYRGIRRGGPAFYHWMYMFERFLSTLTRKIHDRKRPESNLINAHLDDIATRHVMHVYAPTIKRSFHSEAGQVIFDTLLSVNESIGPPKPEPPTVIFPKLRCRPPWTDMGHLSDTQCDELGALLAMEENMFESFRIMPQFWKILRGVRIHGTLRKTCCGEHILKRASKKQGSTSAFILDNHTIGRIVYFASITIEELGGGSAMI